MTLLGKLFVDQPLLHRVRLLYNIDKDSFCQVVNGKETAEGQVDVRFFGGYHRKALVERHHIKPISTNVHSLQV